MALTLLRIRSRDAELRDVWRWAVRRHYLPRGADPGYALHAALNAALGAYAPRPFVMRSNGSPYSEILGYTKARADDIALARNATGAADAEIARWIEHAELDARELPGDWEAGRQLDFEVRVRPVVRTTVMKRAPEAERTKSFERDAFLWALETTAEEPPNRSDVYCRWLEARFRASHAAGVHRLSISRLDRARLFVRPEREGRRQPRLVEGPDVTFRGTLEISDPQNFSALLERGIGRHRAFGFGCLLLAPPGSL